MAEQYNDLNQAKQPKLKKCEWSSQKELNITITPQKNNIRLKANISIFMLAIAGAYPSIFFALSAVLYANWAFRDDKENDGSLIKVGDFFYYLGFLVFIAAIINQFWLS
jgi:hypothetical protein